MKKILLMLLIFYTFMITFLFFNRPTLVEVVKDTQMIYETVTEVKYVYQPMQYEIYEVTAYTDGYESTNKTVDHPLYGITASGEPTIERITIACPKSLEFGTKIYIPAFETVFTCQDRGSAITEGKLDIYMQSLEHAKMFGRQKLEVMILPNN